MNLLALLGLLSSAHAADPTVAITSFYLTNPSSTENRTAEICGTVSGAGAATRVVVTVDPGDHAGTYVAWPGADGHWCALVNTLIGRASAAAWNGSARVAVAPGVDTSLGSVRE